MMTATNYIDRMKAEYDELSDRFFKLSMFQDSEIFAGLSLHKQDLLCIQTDAMETYLTVLRARISLEESAA